MSAPTPGSVSLPFGLSAASDVKAYVAIVFSVPPSVSPVAESSDAPTPLSENVIADTTVPLQAPVAFRP